MSLNNKKHLGISQTQVQKPLDFVWLSLVFLFVAVTTSLMFTIGIIKGVMMLANLGIFCAIVYQHHQRTGMWQLPLPPKSIRRFSTKEVITDATSKGKGNREV